MGKDAERALTFKWVGTIGNINHPLVGCLFFFLAKLPRSHYDKLLYTCTLWALSDGFCKQEQQFHKKCWNATRPVSLKTGLLWAGYRKDRQKIQSEQVVFCWWPSGPRLPFLPFSASPHTHKKRVPQGQIWTLTNRHFYVLAKKFSPGRKTFLTVYTEQCSCNNWAAASAEAPLVTARRNLYMNSSSYLPWEAYWFWTSADLAPELQFSFIRAYQKKPIKQDRTLGLYQGLDSQDICGNLLMQDLKSSKFTL